jgi:hypothetical protein
MFTREYITSIYSRKPLIDRLKNKMVVDENGCHIFTGTKDRCGYGGLSVGKHRLGTHKIMYLLVKGDYDQKNLELMHTCDNPACMNPDHLVPGTHKENIHDCLSKGRHTTQIYTGLNLGRGARQRARLRSGEYLIQLYSTRSLAIASNHEVYSASKCKIHNMPWRATSNGACIYCRENYKTSCKKKRVEAAAKRKP